MKKNTLTINNEFYKLFKHRVDGVQNTPSTSKEQYVLFKEHVDLLQKAEQFIRDIQDGIWNENLLVELFERKKSRREIDQVCAELDTYRFPLNLISNPILSSSVYFVDLRKQYENLDKDCLWGIETKLKSTNLLAYRKAVNEYSKLAFIYKTSLYQNWSVENFPIRQVQQLISSVRANTQYRLKRIHELEEFVQHQIENEYRVFQNLVTARTSLYVFAFDIRFINFSLINCREDEKKFWIKNANIVQHVKLVLSQIVGCIYGLVKTEPDFRSGMNLHCIIYLESDPKIDEKQIVDDLKCLFRTNQINLNEIKIRNWNTVLRKHYSKQAVGFFKSTDTAKNREFKKWVLNYFFKIDQYLQFHSENYLCGQLNQSFKGVQNFNILLAELKSTQASMRKWLKRSDALIFNEKITWSTRHLSKEAKERINLSNRYYRALDKATSKNLNYLEIFIETILDSPFYAFDLKKNALEITEFTVPILNKALTRIGRQFISLSEHEVIPEDSLLYHQLFSKKIKFQIVHDFKQLVASRGVTQLNINDLDTYIGIFRDFLNRPFEELGKQSIASYRINQNNLYKGRMATTTRYLKNLLRKDVKTFHLKFYVSLKDREIKQAEFSKLMNSFLHEAKRAKPLYWMAGYLGFWRYNHVDQPYAEIIFFLDERCFGVGDNEIISLLKARWEKYLDKQYKPPTITILPDETIPSRESRRLWTTSIEIDSEPSVLIESINKERQKKLLTEIIPEFIADCTLQEKPCEKATKALIKGKMPTKKQQVSKKNSSDTDEPQNT